MAFAIEVGNYDKLNNLTTKEEIIMTTLQDEARLTAVNGRYSGKYNGVHNYIKLFMMCMHFILYYEKESFRYSIVQGS